MAHGCACPLSLRRLALVDPSTFVSFNDCVYIVKSYVAYVRQHYNRLISNTKRLNVIVSVSYTHIVRQNDLVGPSRSREAVMDDITVMRQIIFLVALFTNPLQWLGDNATLPFYQSNI